MNTNLTPSNPQRSRIHPLVAGAAVAVILASATGIAAMTGILPSSRAVTEPAPPVAAVAAPVASAPLAATPANPVQHTTQEAAPARPRVHHTHSTTAEDAPRYSNNQGYQAPSESASTRPVADPYSGEVVAINTVQAPEPTTGLGAVGGAVAGGLIGNQIGGGRGKVLATIAGAVGGGVAGNGIEHAVRKQTTYQVQVRMQDGSYRNFSYPTQPAVQVGQRVHVSGDSLTAS
ncbi:glycine zipper 2TM domain-containing protein [Paraburkholderia sp. SIMBA_030]|uniref:glycine zipper 2TM domain-containing protein n=1 Tax=Paraburkholderia sp. SIMBA_030 TaxID=3085773 RepID=UPI0039787985